MPQMKKVKIDGVEGRGYLEVIPPSPPRTVIKSKGVAEFDTREKVKAMKAIRDEGRKVKYEGPVYEEGKITTKALPVAIENIHSEAVGARARVDFRAQGGQWSD